VKAGVVFFATRADDFTKLPMVFSLNGRLWPSRAKRDDRSRQRQAAMRPAPVGAVKNSNNAVDENKNTASKNKIGLSLNSASFIVYFEPGHSLQV